MKLYIIEQGKNKVSGVLNELGCCEVLEFLKSVPPNYQSSAKGFKALFQRYAQGGRQMLTDAVFHEASRGNDIWEFIKGQLRIYCFKYSNGQVVILSHGIIKKSQKAKNKI